MSDASFSDTGVFPGRYWSRTDDGRIECEVCPRRCKLRNGQRGLCFVREARNDSIVLTTYGRSSGFCIDPIEKKPLSHFLPGTPVLSFGTAGCNLACQFCQNWEISKSREMDTLAGHAMPDALARAALHYGCKSVAYTYNDPVIFLEYAVDTAAACRAAGVKNVAVTAGYICEEPREEFYRYMDAANIDLKAFTEEFYFKLTGSHLAPVLETLKYLAHETDVWIEITTLLIPGENDSPQEIDAMTTWVRENLGPHVPMHFSAFHPDFRMRDKGPTPHSTLLMARETALLNGMRHAYIGNVHDDIASSTYCPCCGKLVIGRDWHVLSTWHLDDSGKCLSCGTQIDGVFDGPPGKWGQRRQPVSMEQFAGNMGPKVS